MVLSLRAHVRGVRPRRRAVRQLHDLLSAVRQAACIRVGGLVTPHQRASTHVGGIWAGRSDYAGLYNAHVKSEERAILAEAEVARLRSVLTTIHAEATATGFTPDTAICLVAQLSWCALNRGDGHPECPCSDFTVEDPGPHIAGCPYVDDSRANAAADDLDPGLHHAESLEASANEAGGALTHLRDDSPPAEGPNEPGIIFAEARAALTPTGDET